MIEDAKLDITILKLNLQVESLKSNRSFDLNEISLPIFEYKLIIRAVLDGAWKMC